MRVGGLLVRLSTSWGANRNDSEKVTKSQQMANKTPSDILSKFCHPDSTATAEKFALGFHSADKLALKFVTLIVNTLC